MRAVLGVAVDDGEISAVLVDADVPALGPFDSQRWAASDTGETATATVGAVAAMTERAERAGLTIGRIGLVADAEVADAVREAASVEVTAVDVDAARIAYLANAPELAATPVLALHTRSAGAETVSVVDVPAGTVPAAVTPDGDDLTGYADLLPDAMDEAIARAGRSPQALVFLDLRPGDAGLARELAAVLGVPFVTPHGVPWHRATGAALVAARRDAPPPVAGGSRGRGRIAALVASLVALLAILGTGLAVAIGGAGESRQAEPTVVFDERPVPTSAPPAPTDGGVPAPVPCTSEAPGAPQVRPASWPVRVSDPDPGPAPAPAPAPQPCP
ncbi:hypothetical protein [Rhodococcus phenolicus]|uniref:hypothetical protein n=1 Tax=Rhodococcus phenolicus TaxID=263849 RepID=UPI0008349048|nr:hypothetical protein [Rhodococcus phenolicus]